MALEIDLMDAARTKTSPPGVPEQTPHRAPAKVPPLIAGDHLSRAEFERRYAAMPELKGAQLIEGRVYMPSPVRHSRHSKPHGIVGSWLGTYAAATPGVEFGFGGTVRLDLENEPQPDAFLFIDPAFGGHARVDEDDYVAGAPELIAEVSASTASFDLHEKLTVYRRNGVQEYFVWRTEDRAADWFGLERTEYVRFVPDGDGLLKSRVFPGLWLDAAFLIALDLAAVLRALQRGLASEAHAEFVRRLTVK
jgi:Uma2 family endonuclease